MGIAKDFIVEISKSPEYAALQRVVGSGDYVAVGQYVGIISRRVDDFVLRIGSRLSGYDMVAIAERGGPTPLERLTHLLASPKMQRDIQNNLVGFRDALVNQARRYVPEWYERSGLIEASV